MALQQQHCEACRADAPRISDEEAGKLRGEIPDWKQVEEDGEEKLQRQFKFKDFPAALGWMVQMGTIAERMNHHPEWSNVYNRVDVRLTTHDAGGLTKLDLQLALAMST